MSILVTCSNPACGEMFDVPETAAGQEVRCPACGALQRAVRSDDSSPAADGSSPQTSPEQINTAKTVEQDETELSLEPLEPGKPDTSPPPLQDEAVLFDHKSLEEIGIVLTPDPLGPVDLDSFAVTDRAISETKSDDMFDGDVADELIKASTEAVAIDYGLLGDTSVKHTILVISILGVIVGLPVGIYCLPLHPILAAYIGAGVGWVCGFSFSFFLVLNVDRDDRKNRCRFCGKPVSVDAEKCESCGSPLSAKSVGPLPSDYLKAGFYTFRNMSSIYLLAMLLVLVNVLCVGSYHILRLFPSLPSYSEPVLIGLCAFTALLVLGYCLVFFLNIMKQTLLHDDKPPNMPKFFAFRNISTWVRGICVLVLYSLAIFTVPLLPLGLLSMAVLDRRRGLNPAWAFRIARRYAEDFMTLWLFLLLWCAGMVLAIVVAIVALVKVSPSIPTMNEYSWIALSMFFSAVMTAVVGMIACMFSVAIFRCIGLFGRHHSTRFFR